MKHTNNYQYLYKIIGNDIGQGAGGKIDIKEMSKYRYSGMKHT